MEPLDPKDAVKMIDAKNDKLENGDLAAREAALLGSTKDAIDLRKAEGDIKIKLTKAEEPAKSVAGKHLAKLGALYLVILVGAFIFSVKTLPNEAIAVVAGLITLVVTHLSTLLKSIVEDREQKDPIELMYDIAEKNSEACEREHSKLVENCVKAQETIIAASERQNAALLDSAEKSHYDLVKMLREAQEKQPTSLSIRPDDVVIQQGENVVKTSTKGCKKS